MAIRAQLKLNPRLSICIATLNRAGFIGQTLESIVSQATEEVEIVIVDGASTDNTPAVVGQFQQAFPRLRYMRLDAKGGFDQDYCHAVELATGEYCWLMTDDDVLRPGAVAAVLAAARAGHALIVVNAEVRDAALGRCLVPRRLDFQADRVYQPVEADRQRLLAETGDYLSFIGAVVVRREVWAAREKARYFGSEFVHVGVIFQALLPGTALVLAEPWILIRYGNAHWTSRYFRVWMFQWPAIIWSLPDLSGAAKHRVVPREPWRRPWALFLFRARGVYGLEEYRRLIEPRLNSAGAKLMARIMARLPGCFANLLASLYAGARGYRPLLVDLAASPHAYQRCWARWFKRGPASARPL